MKPRIRERSGGSGERLALKLDAVFLGELLDAAFGIDELTLPGVEWMTFRADLYPDILPRRSRDKRLAAGACDRRLPVIGMDALLHGVHLELGRGRELLGGPATGAIIPQPATIPQNSVVRLPA